MLLGDERPIGWRRKDIKVAALGDRDGTDGGGHPKCQCAVWGIPGPLRGSEEALLDPERGNDVAGAEV